MTRKESWVLFLAFAAPMPLKAVLGAKGSQLSRACRLCPTLTRLKKKKKDSFVPPVRFVALQPLPLPTRFLVAPAVALFRATCKVRRTETLLLACLFCFFATGNGARSFPDRSVAGLPVLAHTACFVRYYSLFPLFAVAVLCTTALPTTLLSYRSVTRVKNALLLSHQETLWCLTTAGDARTSSSALCFLEATHPKPFSILCCGSTC